MTQNNQSPLRSGLIVICLCLFFTLGCATDQASAIPILPQDDVSEIPNQENDTEQEEGLDETESASSSNSDDQDQDDQDQDQDDQDQENDEQGEEDDESNDPEDSDPCENPDDCNPDLDGDGLCDQAEFCDQNAIDPHPLLFNRWYWFDATNGDKTQILPVGEIFPRLFFQGVIDNDIIYVPGVISDESQSLGTTIYTSCLGYFEANAIGICVERLPQ